MCVAVVDVWGVGVLVNHSLVRVHMRVWATSFVFVVMVQVVVIVHVFVGYFFVEVGVAVLFGNC